MAILEVVDISKRFADTAALRHVTLHLEAGKILGLLGPSGCGKTTLLRIVAGLEKPDQGSLNFDGTDLSRLPPDLILRPTVTQADLQLVDFRLQRISDVGGPIAKELGDSLEDVLQDEINDRRIESLEDIVAAFENPEGDHHVIQFRGNWGFECLDREEADATNVEILETYGIQNDRNL